MPTCDYCGEPGYGRYLRNDSYEWIDVCAPHEPIGVSKFRAYHNSNDAIYPAEVPRQVFQAWSDIGKPSRRPRDERERANAGTE